MASLLVTLWPSTSRIHTPYQLGRVMLPPPIAAALRDERGALNPALLRGFGARSHVSLHSWTVPTRRQRANLGAWAGVVAQLAGGGAAHALVARALVRDVYARLHVHPDWSAVDRVAPARGRPAFVVDYPGAIAVPSPNFWPAPRGHPRAIVYVVIHDTESACASALNTLVNPRSDASANFLVCRDGRVYQLVHVGDGSWHAGNHYINLHSIGIEHEGYAGGLYTAAQYRATASILRWVNARQHLNLRWNRNIVLGHENVPGSDHVDPGSGWNWPLFMSLLGGTRAGTDARLAVVLSALAYVRSCPSIGCTVIGSANWGEQFVVQARAPGWLGINYSGTTGWLLNVRVGAGQGTIVRDKYRRPIRVMSAPDAYGRPMGLIRPGQAYASTIVDAALDRRGWWLVEYAHRYGFVCACDTVPGYHPARPSRLTPPALPGTLLVPPPTPTARPTVRPARTTTRTPTITATPASPAPSVTATPDPMPALTPTITATAPATPTMTPLAPLTASPTATATATATASAWPPPTPTTLATGSTPTPVGSPCHLGGAC